MAITGRSVAMQTLAAGKGLITTTRSTAGVSVTAATTSCNNMTCQMRGNEMTTTVPSSFDSFPSPAGMSSTALLFSNAGVSTNGAGGQYYRWFYKLGTLNLAATGDQFTHDTATFPVLRTIFGQASQPVPLFPIVQLTTATATTAPVFRMRTAGGAAGYVNQDGSSVVGTRTMTLPGAVTASSSTYFMRLELGDTWVQDVTNIEVTTAGSAGAATVWGLEILSSPHVNGIYEVSAHDALFGGIGMNDLSPAVATSGTATALLGCLTLFSGTGSNGGVLVGITV